MAIASASDTFGRHAHELALRHSLKPAGGRAGYLKKQFEADLASLRSFVALLQDGQIGCGQQAEEWLLDNAEFIEEQALDVKLLIAKSVLASLPRLRDGGKLRIHALCEAYLEQAEGVLNETSFIAYVNAYQEISVLALEETRAIPLMLRIALVGRIAGTMALVRERREVCAGVQQLLARIESSKIDADVIGSALERAGQSAPLSGPWAAHLISHLREWSGDAATVREWLMCKYENGMQDLDRVVTFESQLQAAYQVRAGNLITSLRTNERRDWDELFGQISMLDRTYRADATGMYGRLDGASRNEMLNRTAELAGRMRVPESLVAAQALALAEGEFMRESKETRSSDDLARGAFAAYYLFEPDGVKRLARAMKTCSSPRPMPKEAVARRAQASYFASLFGLFVALLAAAALWIGGIQGATVAGMIAVIAALLLPVSDWVMTLQHFGIRRVCRTRRLLRYDYSRGIAPEAATMVIIPAIWSSVEEVEELADRLEIHYLANRDGNLHFALLGDFTDDPHAEESASDGLLIAAGKAKIDRLNELYGAERGSTFHFYQRRRQWNSGEGVFMGWERKRGKLVEFVELLRGDEATSYATLHGDASILPAIRYIITLDADTQLPLGSAQRLVGTIDLPFNRPRMNEAGTRVVAGHGVLQPRIGVSHDSAMRSRLAYYMSDPGIDPYAFAVSDPYQDALGVGIFTGKGIFDVDVFARLLGERIPDNTVLSHDLLEGGFLRAALVSDVELIEENPSTYMSFQKRMHRWVRGDWQLLCWLRTKLCDRRGALQPIALTMLTRWQIFDNLRRSVMPIALFVLLALAVTVLPGYGWRWLTVLIATLLLPLVRQLASLRPTDPRPKRLLATAIVSGIELWTLPFQTAVLLDAIVKTLYRMFISKRRLLEWTSFSHTERSQGKRRGRSLLGMGGGYLLIVVFLAATVSTRQGGLLAFGCALCFVWALAPLAVRWLDRPIAKETRPLAAEDAEQMRALAGQIWRFYEDYAGSEDHYLPPDNVQIDPPNGVAHRTSPTNIGFLLTAALSARELGFITTPALVERLNRTVTTIERMEKWHGHLYNWYETTKLELLHPAYVSTVDSGNFVASLMTVKQGLLRWLKDDGWRQGKGSGATNAVALGQGPGLSTEFAVELGRARPGERYDSQQRAEEDSNRANAGTHAWIGLGYELADRIERLIAATDFTQLYDAKSKLFVLGYNAAADQRDTILYDLLASEARQTSFVAIALGQVSVSHWLALGRTAKKQGGKTALISWSGTMFEFMMPWSIMRTYPGTVWDSTYRGVVNRQIEYAKERGVPFGISESGYYAFDYQLNYQYRAFGVPGLGFKRGLDDDVVVSPYSTVMALPYALREGLDNLAHLDRLGARGQYGYYEAIDFTRARMPQGETHQVIRSFMAHHQGMSLLTLANLLVPSCMIDYFHADRRVRAAQLLLIERIPPKSSILDRDLPGKSRTGTTPEPAKNMPLKEFQTVPAFVPEANLHGNGAMTTMVTESGGGSLRFNGLELTRWREDPVTDPWGSFFYIRDAARNVVWSPSYLPCRAQDGKHRVQFMQERTAYLREDGEISTSLEVTVSAEYHAEVRRLSLTNHGTEARFLEVTTFMELAMAPHDADKAHPAFTKLFIQTSFDAEKQCLLARKRPRNEGEQPLWAFHTLAVDGSHAQSVAPQFETDRAAFIGRGNSIANPRGLGMQLQGTYGSVADPAFIMRRQVKVEPGGQIVLVGITGVAESREEALAIATRLSQEHQAERVFQLAWTRSQIDLYHARISASDAAAYQLLASRVLFSSPLRQDQVEGIAANKKGQSGLWAHGVSGDRPIALVRIDDGANLPFVQKLLFGYDYLRQKGLLFDLVVWNESAEGYQQELRDALQRMIEQFAPNRGGGSGVHIVAAASQPEDVRHLLFGVSRVVLHADGASLKAQLHIRETHEQDVDDADLVPSKPAGRYPIYTENEQRNEKENKPDNETENDSENETENALQNNAENATGNAQFGNDYGCFSADGSEYRIVLKQDRHLPAPWINVIANANFGFLASELYTGHTWWRNSRECKLTPWSNDPALDPPGEACFLRDEESGEYWGVAPARSEPMRGTYTVTHGQGYSQYEHDQNGISQTMTVYVPPEDPVKLIRLQLKNETPDHRRLSVTYYAEWVIGVHREGNAPHVVTEWDEEHGMLVASNTYQETFRDATAFLAIHAGTAVTDRSWTGNRLSFVGREGATEQPAAMRRKRLSGETGPLFDSCGAIRSAFELHPGEKKVVYVLLGCDDSREKAAALADKYSDHARNEQALSDSRAFWRELNGSITVETPSAETNIMLNHWLLYQSLGCRMWARSGFYQAGGAFGFRDQLQDSIGLLHAMPELTRAQIIRHASHQYEEGDVQHWWHEETHRGIRTKFSDDLLWLPYAVIRYVEHTGDETILAENAPYLRSAVLSAEEHERYEETVLAGESGSILEHCCRAIDRALRFGEHGLPLMGIGDWNDGMSNIGPLGRGESVWLGWFLGDVLSGIADICEKNGDREKASRFRLAREGLAAAQQQSGWDGEWYRRAFTDSGQWLGSAQSPECRIDAIAQSWSVISGMAPPDRALQAMRSFDRELVNRKLGIAHILTPPFDVTDPSPGYIQAYPPGIRENGGQYTHGVIWSIVAWSMLGDGERAFELFRMYNPISHTKTAEDARTYAGEPYVMTADVYSELPHPGHAGWTWYTGASGWMYQAGIEWILGIRRRGDHLIVSPCIPAEWPLFRVTYTFRSAKYRINVNNPSRRSCGVTRVILDGSEAAPEAENTTTRASIALADDGAEHDVEITM